MHIRALTAEDAGTLSEFLKAHPHGCIEQTWEWGELQCTVPGRTQFYALGVFDDKKETTMIGSLLAVRQVMGMKKSWLWCPNGPVLPEEKAAEAWNLLQREISSIAHRYGDVFVRFEPSVPSDAPLTLSLKPVKDSYVPRHSLMIDLSLSEAKILEQMAQKGRYNIKKADKAGVVVRTGGLEDMAAFHRILEETGERDGFHHHSKEFYDHFVTLLEGNAELFLADLNGEVLGGMLVSYFGDRATYYFGASSNKHRGSRAPYALQWHAIKDAKNRGCLHYDFLGIAPEDQPDHPLKGVTQFKTRFGGKRVEYHTAEVLILRPLWWWIYRLVKGIRN